MIIFTLFFFFKKLYNNHYLLPKLTLNPNPNPSTTTTIYCPICLHHVNGGETYRKLPKCNHCFHAECIDAWFQSHSTCPLCRTQVIHLHQHQDPNHDQASFDFLSCFLSLSRMILEKICNPLNYELSSTFCEHLRFIS